MDLYSEQHPGLTLSNTDLQSLQLTGQTPLGFFKRSDINTLLTDSILSAGIRVYLAGENARNRGSSSLVACGTKANGFDAFEKNELREFPVDRDPIYLRVKTPNLGVQADRLSKAMAKQEVTVDTFLTAFFSKAMLNDLLSAPGAEGISIYSVSLIPIINLVPELVFPSKYEELSFLAVARSEANANAPFDANTETKIILNNLPCPGHCLTVSATGRLGRGGVATSAGSFNREPYLNPWEDE